MPVKLLEPKRSPQNQFAKFAAYGNVDALALHNVARAVHERQPRARYEIRLIGGNHFDRFRRAQSGAIAGCSASLAGCEVLNGVGQLCHGKNRPENEPGQWRPEIPA